MELEQTVRRAARSGSGAHSAEGVFSEIYEKNLWGGVRGEFYSGSGSDDVVTRPFAELVRAFIAERGICSVVDLGCGDFRVGRQIVGSALTYVGVDVVDRVVQRNNERFGTGGVSFVKRDITTDLLPDAELCIVRQVLQHLPNDGIIRVLDKLRGYRYVLVAEHHPAPGRLKQPNRDIPTGRHTRVILDSGVFLEAPPFSISGVSVLARMPLTPLVAPGECLTVYLIESGLTV